jgi:hypothetical protein
MAATVIPAAQRFRQPHPSPAFAPDFSGLPCFDSELFPEIIANAAEGTTDQIASFPSRLSLAGLR